MSFAELVQHSVRRMLESRVALEKVVDITD
jgi:hypothetical protein